MIGVSGNTGDSTGSHLHFSVINEGGHHVDPYGWDPAPDADEVDDPWIAENPPHSLWVVIPDISNQPPGSSILPLGEGNALDFPPDLADYPANERTTVDDYAHLWLDTSQPPPESPFFEAAEGCWSSSGLMGQNDTWAENNYNLYVDAGDGSCWARWQFPDDRQAGTYRVYVRVPLSEIHNCRRPTQSALYRIVSNGVERAEIQLNHEELTRYLLSDPGGSEDPTIRAGWITLGEYHFRPGGESYIEITDATNGDPVNDEECEQPRSLTFFVQADAVQFLLLEPDATPTPTPTPIPTRTPTPVGTIVSVQVDSSVDDAGIEPGSCTFSTSWREIYFGECANGSDITSGFRFDGVDVPPRANILAAYLRFTTDGRYEDNLSVSFNGEASGFAPPFSASNRPVDRPLLPPSVTWNIPSSDRWELGFTRESPSLRSIIQAVVDQPSWARGNPLAIIVKNIGPTSGENRHRRVIGYDRPEWYPGEEYAAELVIEYTGGVIIPTPGPTLTPIPTFTPEPPPTDPPPPCWCYILCRYGLVRNEGNPLTVKVAAIGRHLLGRFQADLELVELLTRVRDEVMAGTPGGDHLIDLYRSFSPELIQIIPSDPELEDEGLETLMLFVSNFEALVDDRGGEVVIAQEQVDAVEIFLDNLAAVASPELQEVIAKERVRIGLQDLVDDSMEEAWRAVAGYSIHWQPPLETDELVTIHSNQSIPVKFTLEDVYGQHVFDEAVALRIVDDLGNVVIGPYFIANNPNKGIAYQGNGKYHHNLRIDSLVPGLYQLLVDRRSPDGHYVGRVLYVEE